MRQNFVTTKALLWLFSQSGKSAEIVSALDFSRIQRPAALLAAVNDLASPLARAAKNFGGHSAYIPIQAEVEKTVSTRTYTNSLAVGQLGAFALLGMDVEYARDSLLETVVSMQTYLSNWEERVTMLGEQMGYPKRLAILGRGPSMAAVYTRTLILAEAATFMAMPYQAGEFRHGPLELAGPDLTVLIFAGPAETRPCVAYLNTYQKTRDVCGQSGRVEMPAEMRDMLRRFVIKHLGEPRD